MIKTFSDLDAMSHAAADLFTRSALEAVRTRGRFAVALSGGGTPRPTYELLGRKPYRDQIPWQNVHIFWGDERCVPPDDAQSNQYLARRALLDHVPIPPENIHPMDGTRPPDTAAQAYESELRAFAHDDIGFLDLALLGIGTDGHTASIFPDTLDAITRDTPDRWVLPVASTQSRLARITLTLPLLNQARQVVFLVHGSAKADALRRILEEPASHQDLPAVHIQPATGEALWLVDREAAAKLSERQAAP